MSDLTPYAIRRPATRLHTRLRGLDLHWLRWGDLASVTPERPALVLVHGWMDVGASFQFMVDALEDTSAAGRAVIALDWRGFGGTRTDPAPDCYWFPDYLADLDALLDALLPGQAVDLVGHSMGGNIAMIYAGVRPERIRRLVNLEGFGMPETHPAQAPQRYQRWLDELKTPPLLRSYADLTEVAARLQQNNPLLSADKAAWLVPHWAEQRADGRWHLQADAAHKRQNPILYRKEEVLACWRRITAPVLWVEGDRTDVAKWWGHTYPRSDFEERIQVVPDLRRVLLSPCGHMLHHDQPEELARHVARFLD